MSEIEPPEGYISWMDWWRVAESGARFPGRSDTWTIQQTFLELDERIRKLEEDV